MADTALDVIYGRADWAIDVGDTRAWLRTLPSNSAHMCLTSPPYWALRDYGTASWEGGDVACDHKQPSQKQGATSQRVGRANTEAQRQSYKGVCGKCGAVRVDDQIGAEDRPEQYVENMVAVFREVRRVLRPDACCWLNLGDTYCTVPHGTPGANSADPKVPGGRERGGVSSQGQANRRLISGLKHKDLVGIPWMVAFALRADGWYLRSESKWVRRNSMPDSATDRPGVSCETVFLLSKFPKYFFDGEAVKRPASLSMGGYQTRQKQGFRGHGNSEGVQGVPTSDSDESRNWRNGDLWFDSVGMLMHDGELLGFDVPLRGRADAHFAIMADRLATPMVLSGTSAKGVCPDCGAPWTRVVEKERTATRPGNDTKVTGDSAVDGNRDPERHGTRTKTVGWAPGCKCGCPDTVPAIILDPFMGAGTTASVARSHGRCAIGCELNPAYAVAARKRVAAVVPGFW